MTNKLLASSTCVNPRIIRKTLGQLKAAGLIEIVRSSGGASISKPLNEITGVKYSVFIYIMRYNIFIFIIGRVFYEKTFYCFIQRTSFNFVY